MKLANIIWYHRKLCPNPWEFSARDNKILERRPKDRIDQDLKVSKWVRDQDLLLAKSPTQTFSFIVLIFGYTDSNTFQIFS